MIRGFDLTIHTYHLNLLCQNLMNLQMVRWRLLLEEFHPQVKHIAGNNNDYAEALSQVDMNEKLFDIAKWEPPQERLQYSDYEDLNTEIENLFKLIRTNNGNIMNNDSNNYNDGVLMLNLKSFLRSIKI